MISDKEKIKIWEEYNHPDNDKNQTEIASEHGLHQPQVSKIVNMDEKELPQVDFNAKTKEKELDKTENIDKNPTLKDEKDEKNGVEKEKKEGRNGNIEENQKNESDFFKMDEPDEKSSDFWDDAIGDEKDFALPKDQDLNERKNDFEEDDIEPSNIEDENKVKDETCEIDEKSTEQFLKIPKHFFPLLASIVGVENFESSKYFDDEFDEKIESSAKILHPYVQKYLSEKEQIVIILGIMTLASAYAEPSREIISEFKKSDAKTKEKELDKTENIDKNPTLKDEKDEKNGVEKEKKEKEKDGGKYSQIGSGKSNF